MVPFLLFASCLDGAGKRLSTHLADMSLHEQLQSDIQRDWPDSLSEDTGPNVGLTLPQTGDWRAHGGCRAESECVLLTLATAERHRSRIVFWLAGGAAVLTMQCQGGVNQLVPPSDQTEKNSTEMGWCGCDCWCHSLVGSNLILMGLGL